MSLRNAVKRLLQHSNNLVRDQSPVNDSKHLDELIVLEVTEVGA